MQQRVLIVDDDFHMREALGLLFSGNGYACELAEDAATALEIVERQTFDVVISDVRMHGMNGLELLDRVKESHPALPFIVMTAAGAIPQAVDAIKRGAFEYVVTPCDMDDLCRIVTAALERSRPPGEVTRRSRPPRRRPVLWTWWVPAPRCACFRRRSTSSLNRARPF